MKASNDRKSQQAKSRPGRKKTKDHNLARLRLLLGLGQKELADLCKCSTPTIQAVELEKLTLSNSLALRVSSATGVSVAWLLENNLEEEPFTPEGIPYTPTVFQYIQSQASRPITADASFYAYDLLAVFAQLVRIATHLSEHDPAGLSLLYWKTEKFLNSAIDELAAGLDLAKGTEFSPHFHDRVNAGIDAAVKLLILTTDPDANKIAHRKFHEALDNEYIVAKMGYALQNSSAMADFLNTLQSHLLNRMERGEVKFPQPITKAGLD